MYRLLTRVHRADGSTTQHVSPPMARETADAWADKANAEAGGVATSQVISDEQYARLKFDPAATDTLTVAE